MDVFVSSLISGYESERNAVRTAITMLGHTPVMAEQFGPQPTSPQIACLQGVRRCALVIQVLGARYGNPGHSGLSPTHEEYREAKGKKPIIAFLESAVEHEPRQSEFVAEVQEWEAGLFRGSFDSPEDLQTKVVRAIRDFELALAAGSVDSAALADRARALLPHETRYRAGSSSSLDVVVVGGPLQVLLRPIELEAPELRGNLHQHALFAPRPIFDSRRGVELVIENDKLCLYQDQGARVELDEHGSQVLRLPILPADSGYSGFGGNVLIEEHVEDLISSALGYCDWVFDRIDGTHRLTQIAVVVSIGPDFLAWRTRSQHAASPNSLTPNRSRESKPVEVSVTRSALKLSPARVVEDLLVPLRRQWSQR